MIKIKAREICIKKAYTNPVFTERTVYTNSTFNYVELWLRQGGDSKRESLDYWLQAKAFYEASLILPLSAKPLTDYYCCLNAAKALLACNGINLTHISHGVSSARDQQTTVFRNNMIRLLPSGVGGELSKILREPIGNKIDYSVYDLLYNIPCIHRSFSLTFTNAVELFIPIEPHGFEVDNHKRIFFVFRIDKKHLSGKAKQYIPNSFELIPPHCYMESDKYHYYRTKRRDNKKWDIHLQPLSTRLIPLREYYQKIRSSFYYVDKGNLVWYIKKKLPRTNTINKSPILLTYAVMHWMSELVRYNPQLFAHFMKSKYNWLISEFLNVSLSQFIDGISSEITGANICLIDK